MRIAFAGDRDIAVWVLEFLLAEGIKPEALLVSSPKRASHAGKLKELCAFLPPERILSGTTFRNERGQQLLSALQLDYVIGIHFPYIVPQSVLSIPKYGVLNLHPAYLPYNRGWHTPSWAILEGTPIGATLHFMDKGVDTGDIVHQKRLTISPDDTANSLYSKLKVCELETFREAWPHIMQGTYQRHVQDINEGTAHKREELFQPVIQELNLDETMRVEDVLRRIRALTTSDITEATYFTINGKRYRIQIDIQAETV